MIIKMIVKLPQNDDLCWHVLILPTQYAVLQNLTESDKRNYFIYVVMYLIFINVLKVAVANFIELN